MKKLKMILLFTIISATGNGQTYQDSINMYREQYKKDFLEDDHSPLKKEDLIYLRFFEADEKFRVSAQFTRSENAVPFDMPTMNGNKKKYIEYGTLTFKLSEASCSLRIYQSINLMRNEEYKDYLFLPFMDQTNGETTYGGGRYLDYRVGDIVNNEMTLDFNKAYNPYCAYSPGYSCPKPPSENKLSIFVNAGEKEFAKEIH